MIRRPKPCKTAGCGLVYTPGYFAIHVLHYHEVAPCLLCGAPVMNEIGGSGHDAGCPCASAMDKTAQQKEQ